MLSERTDVKLQNQASLSMGKCSDQYMRNFYCLDSQLAFYLMWLSLHHDHASSAKASVISLWVGDRYTLHHIP